MRRQRSMWPRSNLPCSLPAAALMPLLAVGLTRPHSVAGAVETVPEKLRAVLLSADQVETRRLRQLRIEGMNAVVVTLSEGEPVEATRVAVRRVRAAGLEPYY